MLELIKEFVAHEISRNCFQKEKETAKIPRELITKEPLTTDGEVGRNAVHFVFSLFSFLLIKSVQFSIYFTYILYILIISPHLS